MAKKARRMAAGKKSNGANIGFEAKLFKTADKLRGSMEPSDYKHVVLGLIFLKYISDAFEAKRAALLKMKGADSEDRDEYTAERVFWVPKKARWTRLRGLAKQAGIGGEIDGAMGAIEKENPSLKGVLPKGYARPALDKAMLGELVDLISGIAMDSPIDREKDLLGRVYEYFLSEFAGAEGKRGGEFFTPRAIVRLLVEMMEPHKGRIYDPCCGSGGMFVQSGKFIAEHGGRVDGVAIYGQERSHTTWRLAKMNLALRGMDADIRWNSEGSFYRDALPEIKADYILANPPFNLSDWGGERLRDDPRWRYGMPPAGNANFAWLQHIIHHLAPGGVAGVVLANGSMSSAQAGEGEIRRGMIKAGLVDCMIALPPQLFYSTQIPACLWVLRRAAKPAKRRGKVLFIDARQMGEMVDRRRRDFADADIAKIADAYRAWRGGKGKDIPGFCKSATQAEVAVEGYMLTPGRYVGMADEEEDGEPFADKMARLTAALAAQMKESRRLDKKIADNLARFDLGGVKSGDG